MANLFFSYCHADEDLRNQLEKHLVTLKRQGLIDAWHDRRIVAGDDLDHAIGQEMENADIILFLVSSDFLASAYCYDVEVKRAMERHSDGSARVIPVILRPCDWKTSPFGKLMALPIDAIPVVDWKSLDHAFLDIVKGIREAVGQGAKTTTIEDEHSTPAPEPAPAQANVAEPVIRSSNMRVTKQFTERDQDEFLAESFEYVAKYFAGSLAELQERHEELETNIRRIDANKFTAAVYRDGKKTTACTIFLGGMFGAAIGFSHNDDGATNSMNDNLSIKHDDQTLYLSSSFSNSFGSGEGKLSMEGAAEHFWSKFIEPLQR